MAVAEIVTNTLDQLELIRRSSESVLVSFSGGKDSLVLLNLSLQVFDKVECFFMYYVPGIEFVEKQIEFAEKKYQVKIHRIQHWAYSVAKKHGVYCSPLPDVEIWKLADIYEKAREMSGIKPIVIGAKRDDGQWRRTNSAMLGYDDIYRPIYEWTTYDVIGFCKLRKIQIPKSENMKNTVVDLSTKFVLWAYENEPQAYEKLKEYFPFLDAMILREQWFNVSGKNTSKETAS